MGKFTTEFYPASILGYTVSHLKVPQFRGIFHVLTMGRPQGTPFLPPNIPVSIPPRFPIVNGQVIDFSN